MSGILLTTYSGAILGPIAKVLGWIMNAIYVGVYNLFGIESVALSILIITVLIYTCLLPLTIKQQKFAKLSQKMQPEIQAVQNKYKNKKDQESMAAMQSETQMIYAKYGVSPMGSCVQMLIQMPILFALYRVFYNIPAYITAIKDQFGILSDGSVVSGSMVDVITSTSNYQDKMADLVSTYNLGSLKANFTLSDQLAVNDYIVDVIYKLPESGWNKLTDVFPNIGDAVNTVLPHVKHFNYLFGMNISDNPLNIIKTSFGAHSWGLLIISLLVPIFAYITQMINIKLMPTNSDNQNDQMAQQMKMMNTMMPLFSFVMCFTVPVGLGIYWIMSAVVRGIQQFFVNRHIANLDLDDIIKKNEVKAKAKMEKMGIYENQIKNAARTNTRTISSKANAVSSANVELEREKASVAKQTAKAGSMAAKANKVREFNERNTK